MRLLIIRFSALGDVAMTVPIIDSLARQYPQLEITVLSKPFMAAMFTQMPKNLRFQGIDVSQYEGITGLLRLFYKLRKEDYDIIADLHNVLRSKIVRWLFFLSGKKTAHIDKGRKEKVALTRTKHKVLRLLTSSFVRYRNVFQQLDLPVTFEFKSIYGNNKGEPELFKDITGPLDDKYWIGIAPFAAHKGKILPDSTIDNLIKDLSSHENWRIFLFGGGKIESEKMRNWANQYPNTLSLAGKLDLNKELALMSHLKVMVSMDSANMHLASLTNTPVVSIWGATHPCAGFMGWRQSTDNAVQEELSCRPCSIFGNKPCYRKDYACLTRITSQQITEKIKTIINS